MTGRERGAARRYAQALLDLALERGQAAEVRQELRGALAALETHADLRAMLMHPAVKADQKKAIAAGVWKAQDGPEGLVARLLALLAERHRVGALAAIEEAYGAQWNARRQVLTAELVSAVPLDTAQVQGLGDAVRRATGRGVEFKTRVDPRLLGGVQLAMQGKVYDGSVRARLRALRERLVQGGRPA